ncbi:hypothetical protein AMC81_CH02005 [Rhizobium phaseoli]|uniref:Uncharacterized protein n=1 Tax=Rhizobium phaseoli TaxID=396 RepID=A0ABN4QNC8_9HYPH|nr:hypothetical protein AMC81_CH02005 [Rhizobium phaseoli]
MALNLSAWMSMLRGRRPSDDPIHALHFFDECQLAFRCRFARATAVAVHLSSSNDLTSEWPSRAEREHKWAEF